MNTNCLGMCLPGPSLVSVIIPYFRSDNPEYFASCLRSVLKSSYRPLEIILVRDGAVPGTIDDVIEKFLVVASIDYNLSIRNLKLDVNVGPGAARNRGIKEALGDFIAILDSDDEMFEERIQEQMRFLSQKPSVSVVGSNYVCVDESGKQFAKVYLPLSYQKIKILSSFINPIANPTVMARASVLKKYLYDESLRFGEDYCLWIKMLSEGVLIENVDIFGIKYRASHTFVDRRKGLKFAVSDMKNKLATLNYQPFWLKSIVMFTIPMSFVVRTFPRPILKTIYSMRRRISSKRS